MSAIWCTPSSRAWRTAATSSASPSISSSGVVEADVLHPRRALLERQAAALGQRCGDRVEAAGGGAREQAARVVGDGDVVEAGEVDVEHGVLGAGARSARTMPKAERSMPSSVEAGLACARRSRARPSRGGPRRRRRACGGRRASRRCRAAGSRAPPRPSASGCGRARRRGRPPPAPSRRRRPGRRACGRRCAGSPRRGGRAWAGRSRRTACAAPRSSATRVGDLAVAQDARAQLGHGALVDVSSRRRRPRRRRRGPDPARGRRWPDPGAA